MQDVVFDFLVWERKKGALEGRNMLAQGFNPGFHRDIIQPAPCKGAAKS